MILFHSNKVKINNSNTTQNKLKKSFKRKSNKISARIIPSTSIILTVFAQILCSVMRIKSLYLPVTSAKIKLPPQKSVSIEIHSSTPIPSSVKNGSTVEHLFSKSSIKQLMRVKTRLPRSIAAPIMTNFTMRMRIHALIGLSVLIKLKSQKLVLTHVLIRQLQRRSVP